ncbi:MAG: alpha-amylase [Clostridia bacterium]|nr:alpha-amylase [Clostridia bacterium]
MINGTILQGFEWDLPADGLHWRRLTARAGWLAFRGFTAVWLPPASKGGAGIHDVGYGVYDLYDLGEFHQKGTVRTKYGTASEYIACVRAMRDAGIQPLADVVLNHRMGGDEKEIFRARPCDPENRLQAPGEEEDIACYTRFTFPGRGGRYSSFVWTHDCFTGSDFNELDPDHRLFLFAGKEWAPDTDGEKGNYDYLMGCDVDVRYPPVREELLRWGRWFLERTGVEGFRLDAVKHISASFYRDWLRTLREETGRELFAVGEYWNSDLGTLTRYLDAVEGCMQLFDVPLHYHLAEASSSGGAYDMRNLLAGTLVDTRAQHAVTFVDNHDTQPGQSLESWVGGWFKAAAYGLILLRKEGYPCVFWGDLEGIPDRGIGAVPELKRLLRLRLYSAYGTERDWFDDPDIVGFTRDGDSSVPGSGLAFLCTNARGGVKRMEAGRRFAGKTFRCILGGQPAVTIGADGWGEFAVKDGGVSVYVPAPGIITSAWRVIKDIQRAVNVFRKKPDKKRRGSV